MASVKPLDFDDYRAYSGSSNPTKQSEFQDYSQNQNTILTELTQTIAWQPSTSYAVGNVVYCGGGLWARCITAGTSGTAEPSWSEGNVGDGAARWTVTETVAALASAISVLNAHIANSNNPHSVTKAQVGLGSVVNTGDSATPVSGGETKFTTGGAYTELAKKQATLVSGTNIKTINSTNLLGSGNIEVQSTLVSGTNIKTINNKNLLGSGDINCGGFPDYSTVFTLSAGSFTPSVNGWIRLYQPAYDYNGSTLALGNTIIGKVYGNRYPGEYYCMYPVSAGKTYTITLNGSGTAVFFACL